MTITEWDGVEEETKGQRCVFTCVLHPRARFTHHSDSVMASFALSDHLPPSSVEHLILQALDAQSTERLSPHEARIPILSPQLPTCQNLFLI
jgi:hypothetical protein